MFLGLSNVAPCGLTTSPTGVIKLESLVAGIGIDKSTVRIFKLLSYHFYRLFLFEL
jgi:hypothetical protein